MDTPNCSTTCAGIDAENLNRDCRCISVDRQRLQATLAGDPQGASLLELISATRPHLFAQLPVFVGRTHIAQMQSVVRAIETVVETPAYREHVLAHASDIARYDPGPRGVFLGYDFHLGINGPQLIEINTNAGGALLNVALADAQRACCAEVEPLLIAPGTYRTDTRTTLLAMFLDEWRRQRSDATLRRIAIVDDEPSSQYLWPEFVLFRQLFESAGYEAMIVDASALCWRDGRLSYDGKTIDLVYNRLTDFLLEQPSHTALRAAYLAGGVVVTPHPRAHALYANKRNLTVLSDEKQLATLGVPPETRSVLAAHVPRATTVNGTNADMLWTNRRRLFFKPVAGFGSRAAYRGDKLTRGVWEKIVNGNDYIAQDRIEPSGRRIDLAGQLVDLKLDLRCYVYAGDVQLVAARLYQGQTTNFRTAGGGFAPVFTTSDKT